MKNKPYFIAILSIFLLAALACGGSDAVDTGDSADSGPPPSDVLFQDDFADTSSGWDRVNVEEGITDYENGYYRIFVNTDQTDVWANPGLNFTDVIVEVDTTKVGGPDDNDLGIICRYVDAENFYQFVISSDGFYGIAKVVDGIQELVGMDAMSPHDDINIGDASNHMRADCIGSNLVLYVNGTKVAEVQDSTYSEGDVGLFAGTFDEIGTDIHFDNFVVKKP
jgi:hypothetical protein